MTDNKIDLVVWDIETIGFLEKPPCIVTEIGAIIVRGEQVEEKNWVFANDGVEIPEFITKLTGIDQALIDKEGLPPYQAITDFHRTIMQAKRHVTHNGLNFDIPYVVEYMMHIFPNYDQRNREGLTAAFMRNAFDTSLHFKAQKLGLKQKEGQDYLTFCDSFRNKIVKGIKHNLDLCCAESGISIEGIERHRALPDARLTHELYKKII